MKTKTLIILSICLLLFANREVKAKSFEKSDDPKTNSMVTANHSHVAKMTQILDKRLKLANMLPEDIREKIKKMLAKKDINGLANMSFQLTNLGDYNNALLIASNFLAIAETKTEEQMANSFYAILASDVFCKRYKNIDENNKAEYENIKKSLKESLGNISDNIDETYKVKFLVDRSLSDYSFIAHEYDNDIDSLYEFYDFSADKLDKHYKYLSEKHSFSFFMSSYIILCRPQIHGKIKISE